MQVVEKFLPLSEKRGTYVRICNPSGKNTPLILCHGGPGSTHNYLELLDPLAEMGDRPLVYFDQFGCGLSSTSADPNAYNPDFWVQELDDLRSYLDLRNCFLLGHSWGGMLVQLYLQAKGQEGIKGIILSSTLCSSKQWSEQTHILCKQLSPEDQKTIEEGERAGNYDSPAFQRASQHYLKLTVSDIDYDRTDLPECIRRKKKTGDLCYRRCWGPSEFTPLGLLKDYDTRDFLPQVHCPALVLYGGKDESNKPQNETIFRLLGGDKIIHCFPESRHMTYFEARKDYLALVNGFLKTHD